MKSAAATSELEQLRGQVDSLRKKQIQSVKKINDLQAEMKYGIWQLCVFPVLPFWQGFFCVLLEISRVC